MSGQNRPDPESLMVLAAGIKLALQKYEDAREGYEIEMPGPPGGPPERRRIPRDVNLGPSPANPYVGAPPPLWASLPKRNPGEPPYGWIRRCGIAAIEAALSVLATDEGWHIDKRPGPAQLENGWRLYKPGEANFIDVVPGNVAAAVPFRGKKIVR